MGVVTAFLARKSVRAEAFGINPRRLGVFSQHAVVDGPVRERLSRFSPAPPDSLTVGTATGNAAADRIIRPEINEGEALHAYEFDP